MKKPNCAILGAGIAGLSMGLFAKDQGFDIPIFEKGKKGRDSDNVLWIAPNGLHLLRSVGLLPKVLAKSCRQECMIFASHRFTEFSRLDCDLLAKTSDFPIVAIRRRDLMQVLEESFLESNGVIHYEADMTPSQSEENGIDLLPTRGGKLNFDVLLAADGMGSQTRRSYFKNSQIHYQGIRTYLGFSRVSFAEKFKGVTYELWGQGTRFMMSSLDGETIHWSAMERVPYEMSASPIPIDAIERLLVAFRTYHQDVIETIKGADFGSIHRSNFSVVRGLDRYHSNSIALLGDAAHGMPPNMGQGASLALEDAAFLARMLRLNPDRALATYSHERKPRADMMMSIANSMNVTFQPQFKILSLARNGIARALPNSISQRRMTKLYQIPFSYQSHKE